MPTLTRYEQIAFDMIRSAARANKPCPSNLDIEMALGCNSTSVAPVVVRKLEEKGLISVQRYQRSRDATVTETGESTATDPQRKTTRKHIPRGEGSTAGKLSKQAREMK